MAQQKLNRKALRRILANDQTSDDIKINEILALAYQDEIMTLNRTSNSFSELIDDIHDDMTKSYARECD